MVALHPGKGTQGTNIDRHEYETIRDALLAATDERGVIAFRDLAEAVRQPVGSGFEFLSRSMSQRSSWASKHAG